MSSDELKNFMIQCLISALVSMTTALIVWGHLR